MQDRQTGVTLDKDVIASVPADSDIGNEKITVGTTKLNVNESVFTKERMQTRNLSLCSK